MSKPLTSSNLLSLLANRRSYYALNSTSPIEAEKIKSILSSILHTTPSAFNVQSTRLILLLSTHHKRLWDITASTLRPRLTSKQLPTTLAKLDSFRSAAGTVLFYEDQNAVKVMQGKFPMFADHFGAWTDQTCGMHQLAVWTALEAEGLGCNLQHYNPVIDGEVAREWGVDEAWELKGQMVFGGIEGGRPEEKEKRGVEEVLRVFGDDGAGERVGKGKL